MSRRTPTARLTQLARHVVALALLTGVGAALFCGPARAQGVEPADTLANPGGGAMGFDRPAGAPQAPAEDKTGFDAPQAAPTPAPSPPEATTPPRPIARVARVGVAGRVLVDSLRILRTFDVPVGSVYDARSVQQGLRRLWATNLFDDLEVRGQTTGDGIALVVRVAERPRVAGVSFRGVEKLKEEDVLKHVGFQAGESWRNTLLTAGRDSVLLEYRKEGYRDAQVVASADSGVGGMRVEFVVTEGKKAKVTGYHIEGNTAFPTKEVTGVLASGKAGFPFKSGTVKEEKLAEDLEKVRKFYRERGYRDVKVERLPFVPDPKGKGVLLGYKIEEGPFYHMGEVRWQGNEIVPPAALASLPQPFPGGPYNGTRITDAVSGAYSLYAEAGYLYVNIEPTEIVRDSNVVDVAFQIGEGPPSHVRQVRITGNTYTKENVIRRELELHEGDLFRRSRLMNSQQNVFRLGYFGDVGVDFQGVDSADVDVIFKIKEKQTGTAQAGAGYSSDGGLTGFLNLGHNNLFGNGQAINIALERGGRRRNVELSFTDPWYHNTPLTVGGSAFISSRDVGTSDAFTDYQERRRGFSLQVGRPIPHVRYTRGTLRYQLEAVDISVNSLSASPSLLALATAGEVLTSSIEASLSRNNTNNPFYPSKGQRATLSSEFAGGPLGGDFSFNKTRLETRWYFPSVKRNAAHMLRVRLGGLGAYANGDSVPVYERFRLGGVTLDGLRGYDDYSIVPRENETFPRYAPGSGVTEGSFAREPVPYPGGRFFGIVTVEEQFLIMNPVHGVLFAEAGNTWNRFADIRLFDARRSVGFGLRVELPVLGNVGFDYAYGFDKANPGWRGHFLLGAALF